MSRRKQTHPKSFKGDEVHLFLPDELHYDRELNCIVAKTNLNQGHRFGPYAADRIVKITDRIEESFQLLDKKDNWLGLCSTVEIDHPINLIIFFQNQQLHPIISQAISCGTHLCTDRILLPTTMTNFSDKVQIKEEPNEPVVMQKTDFSSNSKMKEIIFKCQFCGVEYRCENTRNAHEEYYCTERETRRTCRRDLKVSSTMKNSKRKSNELSHLTNSTAKRPVVCVPIPIRTCPKPFDLVDSSEIYPCRYCSIEFRSLKTLRAHQTLYCLEYRKQILSHHQSSSFVTYRHQCPDRYEIIDDLKTHSIRWPISIRSSEILFKCFICSAMFDNETILLDHMKSVHSNENSIECLACRSRFSSRWNLIRHFKFSHTNIKIDDHQHFQAKQINPFEYFKISLNKSFVCRFCFVQFTNIDTLKQHMNFYCSSRPSTSTNSSTIDQKTHSCSKKNSLNCKIEI